MGKHEIRQQLLLRRKQLDEALWLELSLRIQQRLLDSECFSRAETLALYSPINKEVQTGTLLNVARMHDKRICFPRVCGDALQFVEFGPAAELQLGAFGVAEPVGKVVLSAQQIDLVVVPGVAFDRDGFRLGYGKGFYDRELSRMTSSTICVGLCYEFQLCDTLPVEAHDQQLDYVVTETRLIPCRKIVTGSP